MAQEMKVINKIISAEIIESINIGSQASTVVIPKPDYPINIGDQIVVKIQHDSITKYFSFIINAIGEEEDILTLTLINPINQLTKCIFPNHEPVSGEVSDIIYNLLTEAIQNRYIKMTVLRENIQKTNSYFANVPVHNIYLSDLLMNFCTITGYTMYVGYDAKNNVYDSFFFQSKQQDDYQIVLKEGTNILTEDIQKGDLNTISNYIVLYYYPTYEPKDERWTETCSDRKIIVSVPTQKMQDWLYEKMGIGRPARIRCRGPYSKVSQDVPAMTYELPLVDASNFPSSGFVFIGGDPAWDYRKYNSKNGNTLILDQPLGGDIQKDTDVGLYIITEYSQQDNISPTEYVWSLFFTPYMKITKVGFYIWNKVGNPGPLALYVIPWWANVPYKRVEIPFPMPGWNIVDVNIDIPALTPDLKEQMPDIKKWATFVNLKIFPAFQATDSDYYEIGMGSYEVVNGNGEVFYSGHYGGYTPGNGTINSYNDPTKQTSYYIEFQDTSHLFFNKELDFSWTTSNESVKWGCHNRLYNLFNNPNGYFYMNQELEDCIRFWGSGTLTLNLNNFNINQFDRIRFLYKGNISSIEIVCSNQGKYTQNLSTANDWTEKTIKINSMTKINSPNNIVTQINFNVSGTGMIDGLKFLYPEEGLSVIVKDDESIKKYGQRANIIYAKGITDAPYAIELANKILSEQKEPKIGGTIKTTENFWIRPGNYAKIIIPSKNINQSLLISEVKHYIDNILEITLETKMLDLSSFLAQIQQSLENLKIGISSQRSEIQSSSSLQGIPMHNYTHQVGGIDEINVTGLKGILADFQNTKWDLISGKPNSAVSDIDDAVSKKHTHSNKSILDDIPKSNYNATRSPNANDDITQGYTIGSRWLDIANDEEWVCLDATQGGAVWKKTT
ncbi:MAG: hypothetical protein QXF86_03235 [Candidatus Bilamarchaeaceae archaeon]